MKGFEELNVWKLAHGLTLEVYRVTAAFPADEKFTCTAQLRRAASSIGANIAEGFGRHSLPEYLHFLHYSRGSLMETKSYLYLARDLGYLSETESNAILDMIKDLGVRLNNTITTLSRKQATHKEQQLNNNRTTTEQPPNNN